MKWCSANHTSSKPACSAATAASATVSSTSPCDWGYSAGFVRGLHLVGIVSGALTLVTAAVLAAAAAKRQSPAAASKTRAPITLAPPHDGMVSLHGLRCGKPGTGDE